MRPSHGRRANYYYDDDPPFSIDVSGDGTYTAGQSLEGKYTYNKTTYWNLVKSVGEEILSLAFLILSLEVHVRS